MARLFALSFIWGWSFLFIRVAGEGLTPTAVAGGRVLLGALVLHAVLRVRGIAFPVDRSRLISFAVVGGFGSAVPFTLLAWGGQHIDSGLSAVLNASTPLFTAALAVPLLGERARATVVAGLLIGFGGVAIVAGVGGSDFAGTRSLAVLAPVAAGACYGLAFCWSARFLMDLPPVVAAAGQVTSAALWLAPFAVATTAAQAEVPGWRQLGSMLLLGVVGTGLAYMLSFRIIADLGPTVASLVTYMIPVVALAVGAVVLDEPVTGRVVVGGLVTIASVAVVTISRQRSAPSARATTGLIDPVTVDPRPADRGPVDPKPAYPAGEEA